MKKDKTMINGIINVRKEKGYTSHDVVAKLRGVIGQRKIGHTGTLDPDAVGVLPVCLGKATKLCDLIGSWDKTYEAVLLLGQTTDTEDTSGKVTSECPVHVSEEEISRIVMSFEGDYDQIPPMYSAKKIAGRKLYDYAREGLVLERKPCHVHIHNIELKSIDLPRVHFLVTCSKGTYIRSLCRDIGEKAGCGGCMESLIRTRVAGFAIDEAFTIKEIEEYKMEGRISEIIYSIDSMFSQYPALRPEGKALKMLMNGNPITFSNLGKTDQPEDGTLYRLYDQERHFIGLYKCSLSDQALLPYKVFFDL